MIEEIDIDEIKSILGELRWDNCKVIINGNNIVDTVTSSEEWEKIGITQPAKEEWYGTKFVICKKQDVESFRGLFEDEEWNEIC